MHIIQDQAPILAALKRQFFDAAPGLRADSRRSSDPGVEVTRACLRGYALDTAKRWAKERAASGLRTDEREVETLAGDHLSALAYALGLRSDASEVWRVDAHGQRVDSYVLSGDLTDRDRNAIRRPDPERVLMNWFPRRSVPAWAERATRVLVTGNGEAATVRPGSTDIPVIDVDATEDGAYIHMAATQTVRPWGTELSEARNAINVEAEKLHESTQAHQRWATTLAKSGLTGTNAVGVQQAAFPITTSALDYSGSLTMDQIRADFLDWLYSLSRGPDGEYRNKGPFRVVIGGRLAYRAFQRPSNYAAGGVASGKDIRQSLQQMMGDLDASGGLASLTIAPELEGLGYGSTYDEAIALPVTTRTVEVPVAIDLPIPIYTFRGPAGEATYWITRRGGLDIISDIGVGRFVAKVA